MSDATRLHIVTANPAADDLDLKLKDVNMLDFIQGHFIDSLQESLFIQIYGPAMAKLRYITMLQIMYKFRALK